MENIWEVKNCWKNRKNKKKSFKMRTCERMNRIITYVQCMLRVFPTLNTDIIICMCNTTDCVQNGYDKQTYLRHRLCIHENPISF